MANTYELRMQMSDGTKRSAQFTVPTPTAEEVGARPSTWMPTAEEVGAAPMEYTKRVGNPRNLLDNSYFINPVNSSGLTDASYHTCIDRWEGGSGDYTMEIRDDGIAITGECFTGIRTDKSLLGKKVTVALHGYHYLDNAFNQEFTLIASGTVPEHLDYTSVCRASNAYIEFDLVANADQSKLSLALIGKNFDNPATLQWAALYVGEYTAETLPEYQYKGYGVEQLECLGYADKTEIAEMAAELVDVPEGGGGGEKPWRLLNTVTLTEAVADIQILTDSDGNPFEISEFLVYCPIGLIASGASQFWVEVIVPGAEWDDYYQTFPWARVATSTNSFLDTKQKSVLIRSDWLGARYTVLTSSPYEINNVASTLGPVRIAQDSPEILGGIRLRPQTNITFNEGTFYLYGR